MAAKKKKAKVAKTPAKRTTRAPKTTPTKGKGASEPKLSEALQVWVVTELATFRKLSDVVEALKAEHAVEMERQSVQRYDPNTYAGRDLSPKLKALFEQTRKTWLEETSNIEIAGRAGRIRKLGNMIDKAEGMNNLALAKELIREVREEMAPPMPKGIRGSLEPGNPQTPNGGGARFTLEFVDAPGQADGASGPDKGR